MNESFQIIATLAAAQLALSMAQTSRAAAIGRHDRFLAPLRGQWPLEVLWASCGLAALGPLGHVASPEALALLRLICGAHLVLLGTLAVHRSFVAAHPIAATAENGAFGRLARYLRSALTEPGTLPAYLSLFVTTGAGTLADTEQTLLALALPALTYAWTRLIAEPAGSRRHDRPEVSLRLRAVSGRG